MNNGSPEEKILQAALEVVSENSISKTRMHLIAEKAGMVQSNVHYYFKTKRELLVALLKNMHQSFWELRRNVVDCQAEGLQNKLSGFFTQKRDLILSEPEYDRAQLDYWCLGQSDPEMNRLLEASYADWRAHMERVIAEWVPEVEQERRELISAAMLSMMMGASLQYINNPEAFNIDKYFELCLEMSMNILGQPMEDKEQNEAGGPG